LSENVNSAQVAHELEIRLNDLAALLRDGNEQVEPLHQPIRQQLARVWEYADKEEERRLVGQIESGLGRYFRLREAPRAPEPGADADAVRDALRVVEKEVVPVCVKLQQFNVRQSRESAATHRETVHWLVVGLVGVGVLGSFAALLLGFGVARGLSRSIYHLSVRVQDAANKLGQDLPAVSLTEDGDLHHLDERMQGVVREIEQLVGDLQQREREVLRAEQLAAVGQLAAGVAHELRNPLTSIKMLVQTNREEAPGDRLPAGDLSVVEQEIRRMERCLQNFLDFARPPKPQRRPLDLARVVERTLALVAGRARKQQVSLRFGPPDAPVVVEADAEQVQQLLINLALNALDVMPHGGTLQVELRAADKGQVELRVLDTGPGIRPDLIPRLFQPFVSGKETGLGLGLVIARRIAESHGGSVRAVNRPEGGANFSLRLPAGKGAALR
jgi:two-component system, NtrC family, sensor histidine kinase HydH